MHLAWRVGRSCLAFVAAVMVAGAVGADVAAAQPAQPAPPPADQCVSVYRRFFTMPPRVAAPELLWPFTWGRATGPGTSVDAPPAWTVTYCQEGSGDWVARPDTFPASDPNLCVAVLFRSAEHSGQAPPEQLTSLGAVDDYDGIFDPNVPPVTNTTETYCRQGPSSWQRRPPSMPTGSREDWSDRCITIFLTSPNPPAHTTSPLRSGYEWNNADDGFDDPQSDLIDMTNDLVLYCRVRGGPDWYLLPDATVEEKLAASLYTANVVADQGRCIGFMGKDGDWEAPVELPPDREPQEIGVVVDLRDYQDDAGTYRAQHTMCFIDGRWRRATELPRIGCAAGMGGDDDGFLPAECWGSFPTENYDINYDGGDWKAFDRKIYGWLTDFAFGIGKSATQVSLWSVGWAYRYEIDRFTGFSQRISDNFRFNLTEAVFGKNCLGRRGGDHGAPGCGDTSFRLIDICWLVLFGFVAINVLRGRASLAFGEVLVSVVLMVLATVLVHNYVTYMQSTWDFMDAATVDLLVVGSGEKPGASDVTKDQVLRETQSRLHQAFVEDPYDYINWSHILAGDCAEARDQALLSGPHGSSGPPRELMEAAGCTDEKNYNHKPTNTRLLAAIISAVASVMAAVFLITVGLTVVLAKFVTLMLFTLLPFAVLVVVLPGGGRRLFWMWAASVGQAVGAVVGMGFLLALMLQALKELFAITEDVSMVERFVLMLLLVALLMGARRRLLASGQAVATRWADNLSNVRLGGGGAAWQGATGGQGVAYGGVDRLVGTLGRGGGRAAAGAARGVARAPGAVVGGGWRIMTANWNRHQNAKLSLGNLRKMKRYDEAAGHATGTPLSFDQYRGRRLRRIRGTMTADRAGALAVRERRRGLDLRAPDDRDRARAEYWGNVQTALRTNDPSATLRDRGELRRAVRDASATFTARTGETAPRFKVAGLKRWRGNDPDVRGLPPRPRTPPPPQPPGPPPAVPPRPTVPPPSPRRRHAPQQVSPRQAPPPSPSPSPQPPLPTSSTSPQSSSAPPTPQASPRSQAPPGTTERRRDEGRSVPTQRASRRGERSIDETWLKRGVKLRRTIIPPRRRPPSNDAEQE